MWTYPPTRVLVPVDFGEASARALQVGAAIGERYRARLVALHAEHLEAPPYFTHDQLGAIERQRIAARSNGERYLSQFVRQHTSVPFEPRFVEAAPPEAILAAARDTDLVVMGTHGRKGPSRWWLGSVAERVVRDSRVPVLVVRASKEPANPADVFVRPLMVASPHALEGQAARYASGLAEAFGGTLAEHAAACELDVARDRHATVMVVPTAAGARAGFGEPGERLVRTCDLPMLFVPGQG